MIKMRTWTGCLIAAFVAVAGCERSADVQKETEELRKAQQESPQVAGDLQRELEQKKAEVVNLEEKVALAKQGVTDEVVKEERDLKEAMKEEERNVQEKVEEAKGAARQHSTQAEQAAKQLEQVQSAQQVKAEVKTNTTVVPSQTKTEVKTQQENVPVESSRVIERTTVNSAGKDGGR